MSITRKRVLVKIYRKPHNSTYIYLIILEYAFFFKYILEKRKNIWYNNRVVIDRKLK